MKQLTSIEHYLLLEPTRWLFYCFFQPGRFRRESSLGTAKRALFMLRLSLPLALLSYSTAFITRITLLHLFLPHIFPETYENPASWLPTAWVVLSGMLAAIIWGIALGIVAGATWGVVISLVSSFIGGISWGLTVISFNPLESWVLWGLGGMLVGGVLGFIASTLAKRLAPRLSKPLGGALVGLMIGLLDGSILWGAPGALESSIADAILCAIVVNLVSRVGRYLDETMVVGMGLGMGAGGVVNIGFQVGNQVHTGGIPGLGGLVGGIVGSIPSGLILGIIVGRTLGLKGSVIAGIVLGIADGFLVGITAGVTSGEIRAAQVFLTITICYLLGYYRLPLYPVSALSSLLAYLRSRQNPPRVFDYLHHSALYWDECVYLPLPGLQATLLLAVEQDTERTLEEIDFILYERPQQLSAGRRALLEIILDDLETRDSLERLAQFARRFTQLVSQGANLVDPTWVTPFARLTDASLEAARATSPVGRQARHHALEETITLLNKVHPNAAFREVELQVRLSQVVDTWLEIAQVEQSKLEQSPLELGQLDNPYNPGPALELQDSLFVGRQDLAQQLGEALGRRSRRPTFLLNGERRMGKSSTLKQLPRLLGARYIPIFYDLQARGLSSSTATFLGEIGKEMQDALLLRNIRVSRLDLERLQDAQRRNDAAVYYIFDQWLSEVARVLERNERTILLTFDEFEKLEEAGQAQFLDINLLLDWFRNTIQNRPRLALLFSGVRTLGEMGPNWASYFVNVQTLRVSFLQASEARQLILHPTPTFPGEEIFGEEVAQAIIEVTGCHPFLVQALCSALIEHLNKCKRSQAEMGDVSIAITQVFQSWWDGYFRDLWNRTEPEQQRCLFAVSRLGQGDLRQVACECGIEEPQLRRVIQTLKQRDLLIEVEGQVRCAAPIFRQWLALNQ